MELTLKISDNWIDVLRVVAGFILFCVVTYYGSRYYINRQRRDAEEGQRRIDAAQQAQQDNNTDQ